MGVDTDGTGNYECWVVEPCIKKFIILLKLQNVDSFGKYNYTDYISIFCSTLHPNIDRGSNDLSWNDLSWNDSA